MTGKELIEKLHLGAVVYSAYADSCLLFIYQKSRGAGYGFYEVSFQKRNFMHLAGIRSRTMKAERFYEACLNGELTAEDCSPTHDLSNRNARALILCRLLDFRNSRLYKIGEVTTVSLYNHIEMATGSSVGIVGYSRHSQGKHPVPTTLLCEPLSKYSRNPYKIMFVLQKDPSENGYSKLVYEIKKGLFQKERGLFPAALQKMTGQTTGSTVSGDAAESRVDS